MLDNTGTTYTQARIAVADLNAAVAFMNRIIETRNYIPILGNVLFPGDGTMQATDLDMVASYSVSGAVGHMPFTVALTALQRALKGADKGGFCVISPSAVDDECAAKITIEADGLRSTVGGLPVSDFPLIPLTGEGAGTTFLMTAREFSDWLGFIRPCISDEQTRYYLNGVFMHPRNGLLCGVATDGHVLAIRDTACKWAVTDEAREFNGHGEHGKIMPTKTVVVALAAIGAKPTGDVHLSVYDNRITVTHGAWTICTKIIDGTFPDYTRVIPRSNKFKASADRVVFEKAVVRMQGVIGKHNGGLTLDPAQGSISHTAGADVNSMAVSFTGNDPQAGSVGINPLYLKEVLGAFDTARVYFEWDGGNPLLFHGSAGANYIDGLRVVMPMRV